MRRMCMAAAAAGLACGVATAQPSPWLPGDLAFGPSASGAGIEQVRDGQLIGTNDTFSFVQSMAFDNAGGLTRNARGNLLGANFGAGGGGALYNFATDGTANATLLYQFDGTGTTTLTRVGGVSVSPDNSMIALVGVDVPGVMILEYNDGGANAGDGLSASVTDAWEAPVLTSNATQGTVWLDNSTLVVAMADSGRLKILTIEDINPLTNTAGAATIQLGNFPAVIGVAFAGSPHTAIAYNPAINPFMYVASSTFDSALGGQSMVTVIDPNTWTVVGQIDLNNSAETLREIALSADGLSLYMAQYPFGATGGGTADMSIDVLNLDADGNMVVNSADIGLIPAESSVDFYLGQNNAAYMGIDVAHTSSIAVVTGACCTTSVPSGCMITDATDCAARGGMFQGAGTDCETACGATLGACCLVDSCVQTDELDCTLNLGGVYHGDGSSCGTIDCIGACCLPDGTCAQLSVDGCAAAGGQFGGFGSDCDQIYCVPQGACCIDGVCSITWSDDCTAQGGIFMGDGTTCAAGCNLPDTEITRYDFDANVVGGRNLSFTATPDTSANGGTFTNRFDVFGVVDRTVNTDFADDSLSANDSFGILRQGHTGFVFGSEDVVNNDNPGGTGQAVWTFDISGFSDVHLVVDFAAMGDFEPADVMDFTASIDGGPATLVFTSEAVDFHPSGNSGPRGIYVMESGRIVTNEVDPIAVNGTLVLNRFVRLASENLGSGNTLTLTYDNATDGGGEVFLFDNIVLLGSTDGGPTCVCETDGNAAQVDVFDLLAYLDLWFANASGADIDSTPGVDVFDLLAFLDCWFPASAGASCP